MYTRKYFIFSLLLPLAALAVISIVLFSVVGTTIELAASTVVPYLCFSVLLISWSTRHVPREIRNVAYKAPLIFLLFELGYVVLEYIYKASLAKSIVGLVSIMVLVATYTVVLGYLYVFLMELGYFSYIFQKRYKRGEA